MILKGQTIKLKVDEQVIAKSTGCTVNVNVATEDVSSKDDEASEFDNPDATVVSWDCQNESFVADLASMVALMNKFKGKQFVSVEVNDPNGVTDMNGYALITGISVSAPAQGNATMTLSLTGYEHLGTN
jgi:predicted secreted protein